MLTLNLTQHPATSEQIAAGVIDLDGDDLEALKSALTIARLPSKQDLIDRAGEIARIAAAYRGIVSQAMIGGAPYLMTHLENSLRYAGVTPVYAFSVRESTEQLQSDGSTRKINVFRHAGFVSS